MLRGLQGFVMHQLARRGGVHVFRVFHRRLESAARWRMPPDYAIGVMTLITVLAYAAIVNLFFRRDAVEM